VAPFFHDEQRDRDPSPPTVTGPSPSAVPPPALEAAAPEVGDGLSGRFTLARALLLVALLALALVLLVGWLPARRSDPYTRATLALQGSAGDGGRLFRLNCAGCHGLAAQGLVGPNLHGVVHRKNDRQLIQQVVSGRTPPMPRFQPEPQAMADLLAFLHSLPD
jgi:mono/diheme cytochrome c family protein